MCRSLKVFDPQERYQVLTSVWPHRDITNYTTIEYEKKDYKSLINYLSNKDDLGRVLLPKPEFNILNGQTLNLEALFTIDYITILLSNVFIMF